MPGVETEQSILVREFRGVDQQTDPAFLTSEQLQTAQNVIPDLTYLLVKRQGCNLYEELPISISDSKAWDQPRVDVIRWTARPDGTNLVYWVVTTLGTGGKAAGDRLCCAVGNGIPTAVELHQFGKSGGRYGMAISGGYLYVGNGIDPIVSIKLIDNSKTILSAIGTFAAASAVATVNNIPVTESAVGVIPGTYSYRWVYQDASVNPSFWRSTTATQVITVTTATKGQSITFTAPSVAEVAAATSPTLPATNATHHLHLMLTPPGLPIEFAHDQTPGGIQAAGTFSISSPDILTDSAPCPVYATQFTGNILVRHRGRIWISGDDTNAFVNANRLYATNVLVPGLEQAIYNQGDFFPASANALIGGADGDQITGLAVVGGGVNKDTQTAPLMIFKNASVWAWLGDIIDDDNAQLVQISDRIGCVAPNTIVNTPEGIIFLGNDSVYWLEPSFTYPVDIGIPIRPQITSIPINRLTYACATFHRGFYKLSITPNGGTANTIQWWLDLRPSFGPQDLTKTTVWWGPHLCTPTSYMTVGVLDVNERERLYAGREVPSNETTPTADVMKCDQQSLYLDLQSIGPGGGTVSIPVQSIIRTGRNVEQDPFQMKDWTLARLVCRPDASTGITVTAFADGDESTFGPMMNQQSEIDGALPNNVIGGGVGGVWDASAWDVDTWGSRSFVEGWCVFAPPIRSRSLEVQFVHAAGSGIAIRDIEFRYAPIARRAPGVS